GYFSWKQAQDGPGSTPMRFQSDQALLAHMRAIHTGIKAEYGWPRMHKLAFALVSGLPEPDAIRATLAGGSAQKRRMTNRAKRSEIQGQPQSDVSFLPVRFAVVACGEAAPLCESPKALLDGIAGTTGFGVKATPRWFLWPAVNDATGCDPCVSKRRGQLWFPRRIRVCVRHWTPRHCLHIEPQKANEIHSHLI
ncbi:MAG: hypothetical protein ACK542_05400, partial [Burkholderiales bacterium]